MRGITKKQRKILDKANKLFGCSSIDSIIEEKNYYKNEMRVNHNNSRLKFLRLYSRYATLNKLQNMYEQEEKDERRRSNED